MTATSRSGGDRVANGQDTFPVDGLPIRSKASTAEEYWCLLLGQIPEEILRRADEHQLWNLCKCLAKRDKYDELSESDPLDKTAFSHWMRCVQQVARLSPVFGLGPIDRRRMKLEQQNEGDAADEWENE